jgi:hypothetical protein
MQIYPWLVVIHILAAFAFAMAHGVSAFTLYRVKAERDHERLAAVLDLSSRALGIATISLLVVLVAGIWAGIDQGYFGKGWIWASIVVLVVVGGAMTPLAGIPMNKVRRALGTPIRGDKEPPAPLADGEVAALQASLQPHLVSAIGLVGLAVLVALMSLKPF